MENGVWERLSKNINPRGKKKFFVKSTWQHDIVNTIAKYNPYCSIKIQEAFSLPIRNQIIKNRSFSQSRWKVYTRRMAQLPR